MGVPQHQRTGLADFICGQRFGAEQGVDGPLPHFPVRQKHGGQGRVELLGGFLVVIAHHRHIPANPQAELLQRLVTANGRQIVGTEDRIRRRLPAHQLEGRGAAARGQEIAFHHQFRMDRQARSGHGPLEPFHALA